MFFWAFPDFLAALPLALGGIVAVVRLAYKQTQTQIERWQRASDHRYVQRSRTHGVNTTLQFKKRVLLEARSYARAHSYQITAAVRPIAAFSLLYVRKRRTALLSLLARVPPRLAPRTPGLSGAMFYCLFSIIGMNE